jgi:hypothetical protein
MNGGMKNNATNLVRFRTSLTPDLVFAGVSSPVPASERVTLLMVVLANAAPLAVLAAAMLP